MPSERTPISRLTIGYIIALLVIALLSALTHVILDNVIANQRDGTALINLAGRQRMLSQRIAVFALEVDTNQSDEARGALLEASVAMARANQALTTGNGDFGQNQPLSPEAHALYFSPPAQIDKRTRDFVQAAQTVAKSTDPIVQHAAAQTVVQNATDSLMPFLDQAVVQFTLEANDRIIWLHHAQQLVVLLLLVTLAVEAMLIFRPALRLIHAHAGNLLPARLSERAAGVVNRAAYLEHGARILAGAYRSGQPMALMMVTIDHIKRINDTYGYAVGNAVLQKFGDMLAARLPPDTVIGRIRGEEFSIILPDTDAVQAAVTAGRINRLATELRVEDPADLRCTASIGVTVLAPEAGRFDLLMREADQALNIAREAGHNRFVVHQPVDDHAQSAGRAEIA